MPLHGRGFTPKSSAIAVEGAKMRTANVAAGRQSQRLGFAGRLDALATMITTDQNTS
jgi:hypothetical protein